MSNQTRRLAAGALAAAAALALAPAGAGAELPEYEYAAVIDATMTFDLNGDQDGITERTRASFVYRTEIEEGIEFAMDRSFLSARPGRATIRSASASFVFRNSWSEPPYSAIDCSGNSASFGSDLNGILYPIHLFRRGMAPTTMLLMPFSMLRFDLNCTLPGWRTIVMNLSADLAKEAFAPERPYRPVFEVPRADVGSNWIDVPFEHHTSSAEQCPQISVSFNRCDTMIRGKIRLTRIWQGNDLLAPLVPSKPTVTKKAKEVELKVVCSAGCETEIGVFLRPRRGRGQVYYPGRKGRGRKRTRAVASAAAVRPVASWKVQVRARRGPQRLTLAIPPAARRALLTAGRAHVAVQLDPPRGRTARRDFAVTVRR